MNGGKGGHWRGSSYLVLTALFLMTTLVYMNVANNGFVSFDDDIYVTDNSHVRKGITARGVWWALSSFEAANWHPVTWLSHMADVSLFGLAPGWHHGVSALIHFANTALLFLFLRSSTGTLWRSALASALFCVHPLNVESVAWVAERKNVLSTFFMLLTLRAYLAYTRSLSIRVYLAALLCFSLGLMAKPMLVTLPLLLVFLDGWPLGRIACADQWTAASAAGKRRAVVARLPLEKIPFLLLAVGSAWITWVAQAGGESIVALEALPAGVRAANALVAYCWYALKMIWPTDLAVFYPHPLMYPSPLKMGLALGLFAGMPYLVWRLRTREPYLIFGWFWYVTALLPVIGIIQVGSQSRADRYAYVPLLGLFIAASWGIERVPVNRKAFVILRTSVPGAMLVLLMLRASTQVRIWRDTETLFENAIHSVKDNWLAHNSLGTALYRKGRIEDAALQYREAVRIRPYSAKGHYNYGNALSTLKDYQGAVGQYREALRIDPHHLRASTNLGNVLMQLGDIDQAIQEFRKVLSVDPKSAETHNNLASALLMLGRRSEALSHFATAVRLRPDLIDARVNFGRSLASEGRWDEALEQSSATLRLNPNDADARSLFEQASRARRRRDPGENAIR